METAASLTLPSPHRIEERVVPQSRDQVRGKRNDHMTLAKLFWRCLARFCFGRKTTQTQCSRSLHHAMLAQKPNGVRAEREEQQRARDHRRGFGYRHRCDSIRRNPAAVASCRPCILDMSRGVEGAMSACRVTQISKGGAIDRGGVTDSQNQLVSQSERVRRSARCEIDPNVILAIAVRLYRRSCLYRKTAR